MRKNIFTTITIICIFYIFLLSLVLAQVSNIQISTTQETFKPGENLTLKVSLYDNNNNLIKDSIDIQLTDAEKNFLIEKTIPSNILTDIQLPKDATKGYWTATVNYEQKKADAIFYVETNEEIEFRIEEDKLYIKNIGNILYHKTIQILIGNTPTIKEAKLSPGQEISYRLIAPDGIYDVKVTDGETDFSKEKVSLTGKAIGIVSEEMQDRSPITGLRPEEEEADYYEQNPFSYLKQSKFTYVFVIVLTGMLILIVIERIYSKRTR